MQIKELKIPTDTRPIEAWAMYKESLPTRAFLILPGREYTINHFLLDYLWRMAAEAGFYSVKAEYRGYTYRHLGEPHDHPHAAKDAEYTLAHLEEMGFSPERVTVCAKSLGTIAFGSLVVNKGLYFQKAILLTPVLYLKKETGVFPQWAEYNKKVTSNYLVFGTEDPYCDKITAKELFPRGVIDCLKGADHGLHLEGNYVKTIDLNRSIIENVKEFITA